MKITKPTILIAIIGIALAIAFTLGEGSGQQRPLPTLGPLLPLKSAKLDQVELGKMLFFDPRLSGDGAISCASCHEPKNGWGDGQALSEGYPGSRYFRNAKTILNAVYGKTFFWDGRLSGSDIPTVVRDSLTESHFMNMDGRLMQERLKQVPHYVELFQKAFGGEPSFGKTLSAIAAFIQTIVSKNVPFDQGKLTAGAKRGLTLFQGKAGCIQCHNGPYFSDGKAHNLGVPENPEIISDPQRHITLRSFYKSMGVPGYEVLKKDVGYFTVSKNRKDVGKFLTPTLREVSRTGPYMHNGTFHKLEDVIEFYNRGGGDDGQKSPLLKPLKLSLEEKKALIAFLQSLSGEEVVVQQPALPEYQLIKDWKNARN